MDEKIGLRESRNVEYEESMGILMELSSIYLQTISLKVTSLTS